MKNVGRLTPAQLEQLREAKSGKRQYILDAVAGGDLLPEVQAQLEKVAAIFADEVTAIDREVEARKA